MMEGMTLQELLKRHGILSIRELTRRTGLSRQVGWNLWHGYTGIGRKLLPILHDGLGIPYEELLQVDPKHAASDKHQKPRSERLDVVFTPNAPSCESRQGAIRIRCSTAVRRRPSRSQVR